VEKVVLDPGWVDVLDESVDGLGKGSISSKAFGKRLKKIHAVAVRDLKKIQEQVARFKRSHPNASEEKAGKFMEQLTRKNQHVYERVIDSLAKLARDYPELDGMDLPQLLSTLEAGLVEHTVIVPPSGKEEACYEECTLAYQRAQAQIDRTIYLRTIECSLAGGEAALISSLSGNLVFAAGVGMFVSSTCSWRGWMEVDLMQQEAGQALADCRMACLVQELNWWD